MAVITANPASASYSYSYSTDGINFTFFSPIKAQVNHKIWYDYSLVTKEPNVPFALTDGDVHVYLHNNVGPGNPQGVTLGVILDSGAPTSSGTARLNFAGLPAATLNYFLDEPGEPGTHTTAPPVATHDFQWGPTYAVGGNATNQADGIVLRRLEQNGEWEITLTLSTLNGLSSFGLYEGPSETTPTRIDLGAPLGTVLYIRRVDAPAALALIGGGLLLTGLARRYSVQKSA